MTCSRCGKELKEGAAFCTNCGAQLGSAPAEDLDKTVGIFSQIPVAPAAEPQKPVQPVQNNAPDVTQSIWGSVPPASPAKPVQPAQPERKPVQPVAPQNAYDPYAAKVSNGKVGFGEAIALFFKNYVNFDGRASRSEYWWVFLFNCLLFFPLGLISSAIPPLGGLCSLALMIPGISLTVRRLHDVGKPGGWWFMGLIPLAGGIILLIQVLKPSDGDNQWGPGPAAVVSQADRGTPSKRILTDKDILAMVQKHEPLQMGTLEAKHMMDSALSRIIPTYTGVENLAGAMMLCDPQNIKASIAATDTDTLFVIFKALGYHASHGGDTNALSVVQQYVLTTLKSRF